ncbi:MAG: SirB2 family protein [Bdellovibrionaceae bacterium]|nr:SirB2 family protein [Bdellovibrio sp.]
MSYEIYKIIHLLGLVLLFSGLTGLLTVRMSGGQLAGSTKSLVFVSHGVGLLLLLVSGFGLLARLGLTHDIPNWVFVKIAAWVVAGGAIALVKRKGHIGWPLFLSLIFVFLIAGYFAIFKPF